MSRRSIAYRIRKAREARGWTQAQLAYATGLQPAAVSHFETGRRKPCAENLRALAMAIPITADYLLGLTDSMLSSDARDDCRFEFSIAFPGNVHCATHDCHPDYCPVWQEREGETE